MWVVSAGWRIVIADRKISIEYRVKKLGFRFRGHNKLCPSFIIHRQVRRLSYGFVIPLRAYSNTPFYGQTQGLPLPI